jgi:hypothetical protein
MAISIAIPFIPGGWNWQKYVPREDRGAEVLYRHTDEETGEMLIMKWIWGRLKYAAHEVEYQGRRWTAYRYRVHGDYDHIYDDGSWEEVPKTPCPRFANLDKGEGHRYE